MRFAAGLILMVAVCGAALGQPTPVFEVASIRVQPGPVGIINISTSGTRLTVQATTIAGLILYAFNLKNYQLERNPELSAMGDTMYDIAAKADGDSVPAKDDFRQMMQSLLRDRFRLKVHREQKEMQVYALVVGRNGLKLKESDPDADPTVHVGASGNNYQFYQLTMPKGTMDNLANQIDADRPVVDNTGLSGIYNIKLNYTPQFKMSRGPEPDLSEISIFTAMQDQLGLKLEPRTAMIDTLVVDHVEKPSEN